MLILLSFPVTVFTFRFSRGRRTHTVCFWLMCSIMVSQGKWYGCRYCFLEILPSFKWLHNSLHIVPHEIQVHERKRKREEEAMVFKLKLKIANAKLEMNVSDEVCDSFIIFFNSNFTVLFFAINFTFWLKNLCLWCYCITTPTKATLHRSKYYYKCDVM